ncbi:MAG: AAA family ATPase [Bacteroides acidifaciens]|uniref:ATP-binding protein n=1 Tax=Bacteroides acidifaciens TaxID=85831 RepID=UPI0023C61047|nr:AAA family ATPase [Bacteroides acidifaciens]MDE6822300.1 AAA family ATPase [Bacteroides acidifaciens]MDE6987075.1 AAA family ATPase [Bacteroides acidifaciens]
MENTDIEILYNTFYRKLAKVSLKYVRYLYEKINWNVCLIGIKGARGVGKTTMLLQRIKQTSPDGSNAFYVSLDDLWFKTHSLAELVEYLYTHGVTHLYLDEVHRYPDWTRNLKNINDNYPDLNVVYTGSSMLEIDNSKVDLSRRQTVYEMSGFSFREYLAFEEAIQIAPLSLEKLLNQHVTLSMEITSSIKILPWFERYLQYGYYPFYKESMEDYPIRLQEVASLIIDTDLPAVEDIEYSTVQKAKKMLMILAGRVPFTPNISQLCKELETTREVGLKMLYALDRAGLLNLLTTEVKNYKTLSKPEKIYLNNTNLMYALTSRVDKGNLRETFFFNQINSIYPTYMPPKGDFLIDNTYLFEVGGKGKTFDQIKDVPNSYLAIDDVEYGHKNRIPLWMFGLLY